jgi:hypothetical protein
MLKEFTLKWRRLPSRDQISLRNLQFLNLSPGASVLVSECQFHSCAHLPLGAARELQKQDNYLRLPD